MYQFLKFFLLAALLVAQPALAADLSAVQPVSKGGTGATSLHSAFTNLNNVFAPAEAGGRSVAGTTDTIVCSTDGGKTITYTSSSATAVTLPQANTTGCTFGFGFTAQNEGTGTVTITPTTSTIGGQSSFQVPPDTACYFKSDSTNYKLGFSQCSALAKRPATNITSSSANAFTVGLNGTTNPLFAIDASTASAGVGLNWKGAASGAGGLLSVTSPNANEGWNIEQKGSGTLTVGANNSTNTTTVRGGYGSVRTSSSGTDIINDGATVMQTNKLRFQWNVGQDFAGNGARFGYQGFATSNIVSGNASEVFWNMDQTKQHVTQTPLALQQDFLIRGAPHSFVGTSTITQLATLGIVNHGKCSTNATCTESYGILVPTGIVANTQTGASIGAEPTTGGSVDNFAFLGKGKSRMDGIISGGTKFTTSGCSVSSTTGGATAGTFTLGANSCSVVITMNGATGMSAPNGWSCQAHDRTAPTVLIGGESSSTTTTATITIPAGAGATDVISFSCTGY